jgi:hypothetical protein
MLTSKKVYAMLDNESLWNVAMRCHRALAEANIAHAVMGGARSACTAISATPSMWIC